MWWWAACDEFDQHLNKFYSAQSSVELELDANDLEAAIEEAANFRDNICESRVKAAQLLYEHKWERNVVDHQSVASGNIHSSDAIISRLLKIQLAISSGDVKQWTSSGNSFQLSFMSLNCLTLLNLLI